MDWCDRRTGGWVDEQRIASFQVAAKRLLIYHGRCPKLAGEQAVAGSTECDRNIFDGIVFNVNR